MESEGFSATPCVEKARVRSETLMEFAEREAPSVPALAPDKVEADFRRDLYGRLSAANEFVPIPPTR